ncbi:hypothetical protein [Croceicoccus mobilis]|uniref:Uncharacterized protein n=1 Tax=Croceicoccus mobilis TaxID=1703339 RepID=A0A917DRQ0_9SPHN|nr:hypothetical protein [Croceicoccus mobilis]GGD60648.1 hypothetical protein GCM10010990_07660 [Croceicoccus mobilis]
MNAMPDFSHDFAYDEAAHAPVATDGGEQQIGDMLAPRWAAMHKAAGALAALTGASVPGTERHAALYPTTMPASGHKAMEETLGDLCAMLENGLFAVLQAREHGADGKIAARALLKRFERERDRLVGRIH